LGVVWQERYTHIASTYLLIYLLNNNVVYTVPAAGILNTRLAVTAISKHNPNG